MCVGEEARKKRTRLLAGRGKGGRARVGSIYQRAISNDLE